MTDATTSRNMCGHGCRYWAADLDGDYCAHPKSFEISPAFGASTNRMSAEGHCVGGSDDPSKNTRALFEPTS